jgi:short-subunit dehydrogenase
MKFLRGRNAIVTGASRGIGVHIARALANEGVNLTLAARSAEELNAVRDEISRMGVEALAVPCDVSNADERAALIMHSEAELGPTDILINNAGIEVTGDFHASDPTALDRVMAVNFTAPMQLTRQVLPGMLQRSRGHIVNISSAAGKAGAPYIGAYCASKHALVGLTHSLRVEYHDEPVGFSVICPAFVSDSGMYDRWEHEGVSAPRIVGKCSPEAVAKATIRAITRDKAEIIVNSPPLRPLIAWFNIAPNSAPRVFNALGYTKMLKRAGELETNT